MRIDSHLSRRAARPPPRAVTGLKPDFTQLIWPKTKMDYVPRGTT
jgi:hypothetical protein